MTTMRISDNARPLEHQFLTFYGAKQANTVCIRIRHRMMIMDSICWTKSRCGHKDSVIFQKENICFLIDLFIRQAVSIRPNLPRYATLDKHKIIKISNLHCKNVTTRTEPVFRCFKKRKLEDVWMFSPKLDHKGRKEICRPKIFTNCMQKP